ncbi:Glycosyl hydrolase family 6, cellulase [Glarea lozoyensis ATCC 20868]|uniref:Glucanase n=2 Tax=Glarea lozoyensis TaxID=101852 RepID=S3DQK3_GLAL2|nr:Glycosyl hydrolase family 6, cellulase [Glarea lozoyensis ATCC 20868]EHK97147.1 putative Exoglucanase 3 [Glarea lozoyensis 74030]EPE28753.1 Glycosyl hydrolase family 6, cellulase [Glarea lozoyensis ATCC 20868]
MKYSFGLVALAAFATAAPTEVEKEAAKIAPRAACTTAVKLAAGSNPFSGKKFYANEYYAGEVAAAAAQMSDSSMAAKAAKVGQVGSFLWIDTIARVPLVADTLSKVACGEIAQIVVYDLPGRDCAAKASNGELAVGEISRYKSEYIDPIAAAIKANPNVAVALLIEPDSLPNLVTNANLTTCQASKSGYEEGVAYALKTLNLPNVAMYIDAGHGGWLGWDANLKPGAEGIAKVYKAAGSPKQVFGFATNVAGWNAFQQTPGEFSTATDAKYNKCQDEKRYVNAFAPLLKTAGMPNHAIVDTGRNAVTGLRLAWGDWCNVIGAGFGVRPTTTTNDALVDAFVWGKPGGESDGVSDPDADRYDSFCGHEDAFKPSPQAGQWNQAYFEQLLANAKPPF